MARSILVADPSVTIRRVVELTFSASDVYVEAVASGREALERIARMQPDLVLVDVSLADPSGYEICLRVKCSPRPIPVLLLVGAFESFDARRAEACGADGHLIKPFESRALEQAVGRLLAAGIGPVLEAPTAAARPSSAGTDPTGARADEHIVAALGREELTALARAAFERVAEPLCREMAPELLREVAERVVRERIRELEREES